MYAEPAVSRNEMKRFTTSIATDTFLQVTGDEKRC